MHAQGTSSPHSSKSSQDSRGSPTDDGVSRNPLVIAHHPGVLRNSSNRTSLSSHEKRTRKAVLTIVTPDRHPERSATGGSSDAVGAGSRQPSQLSYYSPLDLHRGPTNESWGQLPCQPLSHPDQTLSSAWSRSLQGLSGTAESQADYASRCSLNSQGTGATVQQPVFVPTSPGSQALLQRYSSSGPMQHVRRGFSRVGSHASSEAAGRSASSRLSHVSAGFSIAVGSPVSSLSTGAGYGQRPSALSPDPLGREDSALTHRTSAQRLLSNSPAPSPRSRTPPSSCTPRGLSRGLAQSATEPALGRMMSASPQLRAHLAFRDETRSSIHQLAAEAGPRDGSSAGVAERGESFCTQTTEQSVVTILKEDEHAHHTPESGGTGSLREESSTVCSVLLSTLDAATALTTMHPVLRDLLSGPENVAPIPRARNQLQKWFFNKDTSLRVKLMVALVPVLVVALTLLGVTCWLSRGSLALVTTFSVGAVVAALATATAVRTYLDAVWVQRILMASELQRRIEVEESIARFIPAEFLWLLQYKDVAQVTAGSRATTDLAVMFTNVRGFSEIRKDAGSIIGAFDWLAELVAHMAPAVRHHGGFVDRYLGDGMMALFPRPAGSVTAALQIQSSIEALSRSPGNGPKFSDTVVSIGVHTGEVCIGTLGDNSRLDTTTISNVVNLASRFEGLTKYYGARVIVSEAVMRVARGKLPPDTRRCLGKVRVKGSWELHVLFDVISADPEPLRSLKRATMPHFYRALRHYQARDWNEALEQFRISAQAGERPLQPGQRSPRGRHREALDRAVATKIWFCRRYRDFGVPYEEWSGEDVWDTK
eukprot:TRINITY_DN28826_c0_g1_i1.p1 TRINITY_DN28826_c0_g1~~TRINITY_DN28826_c0_g1_i1.p1  ORF type:complete len:823 (+),score=196.69 TRINITY_DN28826_c0_g1_i1:125-2593(+)